MRFLAALLVTCGVFAISGCGGGGGCSTGINYTPNAGYAGQYAATATPQGASGPTREFRLSVLPDGTVGGFVRDPTTGGAFAAEVVGRVDDVRGDCDDESSAVVSLSYTLPGGVLESLEASRGAGTIAGGLRVFNPFDSALLGGTLRLETVVVTAP